MRDVERVGDAAGIVDVLPGAAGALARGRGAMVVELQRGADDVVALLAQQAGDDALSTPPDMATRTRWLGGPPARSLSVSGHASRRAAAIQPLLPEPRLQPRGFREGRAQQGEAGMAAMALAQRVDPRRGRRAIAW